MALAALLTLAFTYALVHTPRPALAALAVLALVAVVVFGWPLVRRRPFVSLLLGLALLIPPAALLGPIVALPALPQAFAFRVLLALVGFGSLTWLVLSRNSGTPGRRGPGGAARALVRLARPHHGLGARQGRRPALPGRATHHAPAGGGDGGRRPEPSPPAGPGSPSHPRVPGDHRRDRAREPARRAPAHLAAHDGRHVADLRRDERLPQPERPGHVPGPVLALPPGRVLLHAEAALARLGPAARPRRRLRLRPHGLAVQPARGRAGVPRRGRAVRAAPGTPHARAAAD